MLGGVEVGGGGLSGCFGGVVWAPIHVHIRPGHSPRASPPDTGWIGGGAWRGRHSTPCAGFRMSVSARPQVGRVPRLRFIIAMRLLGFVWRRALLFSALRCMLHVRKHSRWWSHHGQADSDDLLGLGLLLSTKRQPAVATLHSLSSVPPLPILIHNRRW